MPRLLLPILRASSTPVRTIGRRGVTNTTTTTTTTTSFVFWRRHDCCSSKLTASAATAAASSSLFAVQKRSFVSRRRSKSKNSNKSSKNSIMHKLRWQQNDYSDSDDDDDDNDNSNNTLQLKQTEQKQHNHVLEPETQHIGTVRRISNFGAFVHIEGCPVDGLLHISEISDSFIRHPSDLLRIGQQVTVVVLENNSKDNKSNVDDAGGARLRLSMRSDAPIKPFLPDDFQPVTVTAFGIPENVDEIAIQNVFEEYGQVLAVDLLPMVDELTMKRHITKITYMDRQMAEACLQQGRIRISYEIGTTTYHTRVPVKLCRHQKYRALLLESMQQQYQQTKFRRDQRNLDPRIQRAADRFLREIIPYYDDFKKNF